MPHVRIPEGGVINVLDGRCRRQADRTALDVLAEVPQRVELAAARDFVGLRIDGDETATIKRADVRATDFVKGEVPGHIAATPVDHRFRDALPPTSPIVQVTAARRSRGRPQSSKALRREQLLGHLPLHLIGPYPTLQ